VNRLDPANLEWIADAQYKDVGWADVARGAALLGLGIGCPVPPECSECRFNIGVPLAVRFRDFEHAAHQAYTDPFDGNIRAKDHIQWLAAKGDLIAPNEGISKSVKFTRKIALDARLTGSIYIVFSNAVKDNGVPTHLGNLPANNEADFHRVLKMHYDFAQLDERDRVPLFHRVIGESYHVVEFTLDMTLDRQKVQFDLTCGRAVEHQGEASSPGHVLAHVEEPWTNFR